MTNDDIKRDATDTKTDMDKAMEIVKRHHARHAFVGKGGTMETNIALAVVDGIALGRKEGIAMAVAAVARLKGGGGG